MSPVELKDDPSAEYTEKPQSKDEPNSKQWQPEHQSFECGLCGKVLSDNHGLSRHLLKHKTHTTDKPFSCEVCYKQYSTASGLVKHMIVHYGDKSIPCPTCGRKFLRQQDMRQHQKLHSETELSCNLCSATFKSNKSLQHHSRVHIAERAFPCSDCPKRFKTKYQQKQHIQEMHPEVPPFKCDICGKGFVVERFFRDHLASHSDERPFTCSECGKSYKRPKCLKDHQRTHSKMFKCDTCGTSVATQFQYDVHMRHHTNERPLACKHCSKRFISRNTLHIHVKALHSDYRQQFKCKICEKQLGSKRSLISHERAHSASTSNGNGNRKEEENVSKDKLLHKPEPDQLCCNCCDRQFPTMYRLRMHLLYKVRPRKEEPQFICEHCNESFNRKSHLSRHIEVRHFSG